MKHQVKVHIGTKQWANVNEKNLKELVQKELIPTLDKNMREVLFAKRETGGFDNWGKFKEKKAGLFVENTMRYLEKSESLDKVSSYAQYVPGTNEDTVIIHAALNEEAKEFAGGESNEYIMKSILAFDPQKAEQIFDRVVSENIER